MTLERLDPTDRRLLEEFQRALPLVPRPFDAVAAALDVTEADVLARLARLMESGAVSRVGAVCRPNAAGASTLAAIAAPEDRVEAVAAEIGAEPGVNHSYLREDRVNLWFVATGPDRAHVDATLARIAARTHLPVLDLPLLRAYHIDLGFSLEGDPQKHRVEPAREPAPMRTGDAPLVQALCDGLALTPRPFAALADALGASEAAVIARIAALSADGLLSRVGVIVRHRALGWRANAMVCFAAPEAEVDRMGALLAAEPGVTLCYRRRADAARWPYPLFCMIHATRRDAALAVLARAEARAGLETTPRRILFSLRCFKQRGALVHERTAA